MKTKYKLLLIIAPAVFILDQVTKFAVSASLEAGSRYPVIAGFFDLVHFQNTGAAFGLFSEVGASFRVPFFYAVAVAAVVLLAMFYRTLGEDERLLPVALALVFGGIAGNVMDRLRLGAVTDFLSFHIGDRSLDFALLGIQRHIGLEWPAFNVADSAITIAMLFLLCSAFSRRGVK
ncbi:MAG: signal peptidase II [Pseudomonadota bacterium]